MIFGKKPLSQGEIKLLSTLLQLQGTLRERVSRDDILKEAGWTEGQFYGFYNSLRKRSATHYIEGGNPYSLSFDNLVTNKTTALILFGLEEYCERKKGRCPDGLIPTADFTKWVSRKLGVLPAAVTETIGIAVKKKYLKEKKRNGEGLYLEPSRRVAYEKEWLEILTH